MAEKVKDKEEVKTTEEKPVAVAEVAVREKRSRKSYDDREEDNCKQVVAKNLRKTFLEFLINPRESLICFFKEVRELDYHKLMEAYFKNDSMDDSPG
jgi:hypothetical protein